MARLKVTQTKSKIGGTHGQRNTLRSLGTPEAVTAAATAAGVDLSDRAEELGPLQFIRLADALSPPPSTPPPGSSTAQR
jgi:hypothetical protein